MNDPVPSHLCTGPSCWTCGEPDEVRHLRQHTVVPAIHALLQEHPNADHHRIAQTVTAALRPTFMRLLHAEADLRQLRAESGEDRFDWPPQIIALAMPSPGRQFEWADKDGDRFHVMPADDSSDPGIIVQTSDGGCHIPLGVVEALVRAVRDSAHFEIGRRP